MIDRGFFEVAAGVVDDSEIDVGEELAGNIGYFFVLCMELNCILVAAWVRFAHLHVINANAVISERLSMHITDGFADLQELLVLVHSLFVLSKVVEKNASRVVSSALIPRLAGTLASKREDVVVLQALFGGDHIVLVSIAHIEAGSLRKHLSLKTLGSVNC